MNSIKQFIASDNPFIKHCFTADPAVLVHNDRLYIYTGHDETAESGTYYNMHNWLCFSTADLVHWEEHISPLKATDFSWAKDKAYASCVVKSGNRFFWFVAVEHKTIPGTAIGVAVSEHPHGPFKDAIGKALITHDMLPEGSGPKANLDPSVIIDADGSPYIFWGNGQCFFAKLSVDMKAIQGAITHLDLPQFEEGAHIHYRDGWYYLCYGYQMPEKVAYAMSKSIHGPWEYKGTLNEVAGNCETNRPAIVHFAGQDLFVYHNGALPTGGSHRRSVCIDRLYFNDDKTIRPVVMTTAGVWK